jgi:hypothetical protein
VPNNVLPEGDDLRWKKEVDRMLEQQILPALARLEEMIKAKGSAL